MADIFHDFVIKSSVDKVYEAVSTPAGLDSWWTKKSSWSGKMKDEYTLWFGPEYDWRAVVSKQVPDKVFELTMTRSDGDWQKSKVGFELEQKKGDVNVKFYHAGWPVANEHFRISTYCWAMYLRLLKRYVETGEVVRYEERLEV